MSKSMFLRSLSAVAVLTLAPLAAAHAGVTVTNLVTDDQLAHPAQITDPALVNAWGIGLSPTGPFWVSATESGVVTVYSVNPATQATTKLGLTVTIPGEGNVTGQVFNPPGGFNNDAFLFVSEDGTVSGWRGALGTNAETLVTGGDASYKGAALGLIGTSHYLYAADFEGGKIDVHKGSAALPDLAGAFTDPALPAGYAPFNIQNLGGTLYVTYALQGAEEEETGPGLGIVSSFDLNGNFLARIATGGSLNAPWGLAIAPSAFGDLAGNLLVGNFGDGMISRFDPVTHAFLGLVQAANGGDLSIDGLWALVVGNDGNGGSSQRIYFSAGPDEETHGLFGVLAPSVPEPASWAMMVAGLGLAGAGLRRRRARVRFA